jgi:hypothetical protein
LKLRLYKKFNNHNRRENKSLKRLKCANVLKVNDFKSILKRREDQMKKFYILFSAFLLFFGAAGAVWAIPITSKDNSGNLYMRTSGDEGLSHVDLWFDLTLGGFHSNKIDGLVKKSVLRPYAGKRPHASKSYPLVEVDQNGFIPNETNSFISPSDTAEVFENPSSIDADLYINEADLYANGTLPDEGITPSPVPEPTVMLLFGTGLIGLSLVTRRRLIKHKKSLENVLYKISNTLNSSGMSG